MVYTHVLKPRGKGVLSPADRLLKPAYTTKIAV